MTEAYFYGDDEEQLAKDHLRLFMGLFWFLVGVTGVVVVGAFLTLSLIFSFIGAR